MEFRSRYLVSQGFLFLLIVMAGLAVSRLTLEGLLGGSIILVQKSVEHPGLSTSILLFLCFLSFLCFFKLGYRNGTHLFSDVLVLLVSITASTLPFQLFVIGFITVFVEPRVYNWRGLLESFFKHPVLCSLNVLLFCVLCFVVIKKEYR